MRQAWVWPHFPLGRCYTGEVSTLSPCLLVQCKGAAFLDSVSAPRESLGGHSCPSAPSTGPPRANQPALNIPSQRHYKEQSRVPWGSLLHPAGPLPEEGNQAMTGSNGCWPFPSHWLLLLLTHCTPSIKPLSMQPNCGVHRSLTLGPQHDMKLVASSPRHPLLLFHDCRVLASNTWQGKTSQKIKLWSLFLLPSLPYPDFKCNLL